MTMIADRPRWLMWLGATVGLPWGVLLTFTAHRARAADAPMSPNPSQPGQHHVNLTGTP
jgi:hypothetical protein